MSVDTTIILRRDTALNLWAPTALADAVGVLKNDGAGNLTWGPGGSGITGPVSSTITALVRWDDALGTAVRDSNVTLANSGTALVFSGAGGVSAGGSNQNVTLTPSGTGKSVLAGSVQLPGYAAVSILSTDGSGNVTPLGIGTNLSIGGGNLNASGGGSPAGSNTQIQFNNSGAFGASAELVWDNSTKFLKTGYGSSDSAVYINGGAGGSSYAKFAISGTGTATLGAVAAANAFFTGTTVGQFALISDVGAGIALSGNGTSLQLLLDSSGNLGCGGTIPAGTGIYLERSSTTALTIKSTGADSVFRTYKPDNTKTCATQYIRTDTGNIWIAGSLWNGVTASGNEYAIEYYDGSDHVNFVMTTAGDTTIAGKVQAGGSLIATGYTGFSGLGVNYGVSGGDGYFQSLSSSVPNTLNIDATPLIFRGTSYAEFFRGSTSGISFPALTLTTGLSIAVATKTFPLTINGTTVNVLCQ